MLSDIKMNRQFPGKDRIYDVIEELCNEVAALRDEIKDMQER